MSGTNRSFHAKSLRGQPSTGAKRWISLALRLRDWQTRHLPGLKAADQIGRVEAEPSQVRRGEARLVALVADHDHLAIATGQLGVAVLAGGIESPLEDVAGHERRLGDQTVARPLRVRSDVDQQGASTRRPQRLP